MCSLMTRRKKIGTGISPAFAILADAAYTAEYVADTADDELLIDVPPCYWCGREIKTNKDYGSSMTFSFGQTVICSDCDAKGLQ